MKWEPNEQAWQLYLKFEKRYKEKDRARKIYARFVAVHPEAKNWLRWAQFEEDNGYPGRTQHGLTILFSLKRRHTFRKRAQCISTSN